MKCRVVWVTNNLEMNPECEKANKEFPHLIEYVEDDFDGFVVDEDDDDAFWPVREFFMMVDVTAFETF